MKKTVFNWAFIAVYVCCFFTMTACGGGGLSGKWEVEMVEGVNISYEFSGNSYTRKMIHLDGISEADINFYKKMGVKISGNEVIVDKGKYSIFNDKIEFFPNKEFHSIQGDYNIFSFSRAGNTITIEEMQLTKK